MTKIAQFSVPGDPVAWARARRSKTGVSFTAPKQRGFGEVIRFAAAEAMHGDEPAQGPLKLLVQTYYRIPASWPKRKQGEAAVGNIRPTGKPDWDNAGKIVSDALNGIVWRDDAQVVTATVEKHYGVMPRLDVLVMGVGG